MSTKKELTKFHNELLAIEKQALTFIKPFDPYNLDLKIVEASGRLTLVYDYFRVVLSSSPQGVNSEAYRPCRYLLIDNNSGCLLGVCAIASNAAKLGLLEAHIGMPNLETGKSAVTSESTATILKLTRCLPLYEFGSILGGKLLACVSSCKEVIEVFETKYTYKVSVVFNTTLHGKASMYNRLEPMGLMFIGTDSPLSDPTQERGNYVREIRKNAIANLRKGTNNFGAIIVPSFSETVKYWTERWLLPRLERENTPHLIEPLPDNYSLFKKIKDGSLPKNPN